MVSIGSPSTSDPLAGSIWLVGGVGVLAGLLLPWVRAQVLDNASSTTGLGLLPWTITTLLGGAALVAAGALALTGVFAFSRPVIAATTVLVAMPAILCVLVSEIAQSALPRWVVPIGDTSELLTLGAGSGVWLTGVSATIMIAFAFVLPSGSAIHLVDREDWLGLGARVAMLIAPALLISTRPAPWVEVRVAESAGTSILRLEPPTISLAISDFPLLGPVSFVAAAVLLLTSIAVVVRRPSDFLLVLLGASAFAYLSCLWVVVAVVDFTKAVVPERWITVDGAVLADAQVSSSTWWVIVLCVICLASTGLSTRLPVPGPAAVIVDDEVPFVSRFGDRSGLP